MFQCRGRDSHGAVGREILLGLENPGADWVKLEVLGDTRTLLPDPMATLAATEKLVAEGFQVLCYTSDDPVAARRLKEAGATSVMPAGSPIGSGQGILNANNLRICLEYLKEHDPDYPVIVDAGVGTASDVTVAMELGVDAVLLNTGIAHAPGPVEHGLGNEGRRRGGASGLSGRPDSQASVRHRQQSHGRCDFITIPVMLTPRDILGPQGRIAARLDHYEHRDQQLQMADAVAAAIADRRHAVIEAGTGVGKSFAYLVPAILAATAPRADRRASVSRGRLDAHDQSAGAADHEGLAVVERSDSRRIHRRAGQGSRQLRQPAGDWNWPANGPATCLPTSRKSRKSTGSRIGPSNRSMVP